MTVCGKKISADFEAASEFCTELNNLTTKENRPEEQLYSCDDTGLNFKRLPTESLVSRNENSAPGFKNKTKRDEL